MDASEVRVPRLPSRPIPAWPEVLLAAFPVPPDRNPARPWWRAIPLRGGRDYDDCSVHCTIIRDDGLVLEDSPLWVAHSGRPYPPNPDFSGEYGDRPDLDRDADEDEEGWDPWMLFRAMEGDDAEHPRPHPGFRVGQVWATEHGEGVMVQAGGPPWAVVTSMTHVLGISDLAAFLDKGEFAVRRAPFRFLVADPACPHLAPWAPEAP